MVIAVSNHNFVRAHRVHHCGCKSSGSIFLAFNIVVLNMTKIEQLDKRSCNCGFPTPKGRDRNKDKIPSHGIRGGIAIRLLFLDNIRATLADGK